MFMLFRHLGAWALVGGQRTRSAVAVAMLGLFVAALYRARAWPTWPNRTVVAGPATSSSGSVSSARVYLALRIAFNLVVAAFAFQRL